MKHPLIQFNQVRSQKQNEQKYRSTSLKVYERDQSKPAFYLEFDYKTNVDDWLRQLIGVYFRPVQIVVRHLPPQIDQDEFVEQVAPLAAHSYLQVHGGDSLLGEFSYGRAYIGFNRTADAVEFRQRFDRYVFVDGRGHEYAAQVLLAPFQRLPRRIKTSVDSNSNLLLENSVEFKQFVAQQEQWTSSSLPSAEQCLEQLEREKQLASGVSTQSKLLEYVNQRHAEKARQKDLKKRSTEKRKRKTNASTEEEMKPTETKASAKSNKDRSGKSKSELKILTKGSSGKEKKSEKIKEVKILKNEEREWKARTTSSATASTTSTVSKERKDTSFKTFKSADRKAEIPTFTVKMVRAEKPEIYSGREFKSKSRNSEDKTKESDRRSKPKEKPSIELYRPGSRKTSSSTSKPTESTASTSTSTATSFDKDNVKSEKRKTTKVYSRFKPVD
jgi:regulator of nonsense transcripts 3